MELRKTQFSQYLCIQVPFTTRLSPSLLQLHFCTTLRPLTRSPPHSSKGHSDYPTEGPGALSRSPPLGGERKQDPPLTRVHEGPAYPVSCGRGRASIPTPWESRGAEVVIPKATDESTHSPNPQGASTSPQSFP